LKIIKINKFVEFATLYLNVMDGFALAHDVGCVGKLTLTGSLGTLHDIMNRLDHSKIYFDS
jgi:hypothetical protein